MATNKKAGFGAPTVMIIVAGILLVVLAWSSWWGASVGSSESPSATPSISTSPSVSPSASPSPSPSGTTEEEPGVSTCRVTAIDDYMHKHGFDNGDYVVGSDNLDYSYVELFEASNYRFGAPIFSRADIVREWMSDNEGLRVTAEKQFAKHPNIPLDKMMDFNNWEIVQVLVPTNFEGNTYFVGGEVRNAGTRDSDEGDAYWVFIDPDNCTIPLNDKGEIPIVRSACQNGGTNLFKDPSKDVLANPAVDDWKKDGGEKHVVNNNDGADDPQGIQDDPEGDAQEAEEAAQQQNEADEQAHQNAVDDATVVDDNEHDSSSGDPNW